MNAANILVDLLIKSQIKKGKSKEEAYKFALDHLESILSRMVDTEKATRVHLERRVENVKRFMA